MFEGKIPKRAFCVYWWLSVVFIELICYYGDVSSLTSSESPNISLDVVVVKNSTRSFREKLSQSIPWFNLLDQDQHQQQLQQNFLKFSKYVHNNVSGIDRLFAGNLQTMLHKHNSYLEKIKNAVMRFEAAHQYEADINKFKYNNMLYVPDSQVEYVTQYSSQVKINLNSSSVEVPLELYEYHQTVLNEIAWSKQLDKIFKENYKERPTLLWQYVGFITGASRAYPTSRKV